MRPVRLWPRSIGLNGALLCGYGLALFASFSAAMGQSSLAPSGREAAPEVQSRPLPDVVTLMRQVEAKQRAAEAVQQNYLYRSSVVETRTDAAGKPRSTETREYDIFWLEGVPVQKLISKNGRPLDPGELKKQDERIDKDVARARERRARSEAAGKPTDPRGDEEITVSRILALGAFSNPRRVAQDGRSTIAVDYTGDPHAKTQNRAEAAFKNLAGTVWIDEQDHELVRLEGRFAHSFKIAGGLLADIQEGTSFRLQQGRLNDEVWLPTHGSARGSARLLFYRVHGSVDVTNSGFRRFRATSTILPAGSTVAPPH